MSSRNIKTHTKKASRKFNRLNYKKIKARKEYQGKVKRGVMDVTRLRKYKLISDINVNRLIDNHSQSDQNKEDN